jgi:hypothetical protein
MKMFYLHHMWIDDIDNIIEMYGAHYEIDIRLILKILRNSSSSSRKHLATFGVMLIRASIRPKLSGIRMPQPLNSSNKLQCRHQTQAKTTLSISKVTRIIGTI